MRSLSKVRDHMERKPLTVCPEMEVQTAVLELLKRRVSRAPVLDADGALIGILAESDCLQAFVTEEYFDAPSALVRELMTTEVISVPADLDILQAAQLFLTCKLHHLPVVESDRLVGIISRSDVMRAMVQMHSRPRPQGV